MNDNRKIKTSCSQVIDTNTGVKKFEVTYENIIENEQDIDKEINKAISLTKNSLDRNLKTIFPSTEDKMAFVLYCNFLRDPKSEEEIKQLVDIWKDLRKQKNNFKLVRDAYKISKIVDKLYNTNE